MEYREYISCCKYMNSVSLHGGVTSGSYPVIAKRNETTTVVYMIVVPTAKRSSLRAERR